jgi:phage tail sheath protein FI
MAELLASQTVIIEESPRIRTIPSVPTAVTAMVGITERGPVLTPTLITSFSEFVDTFGSFTANSQFPSLVEQFFNNGGQQLWISRVVHYTDITDPLTKISVAATVDLDDTGATPVLQVDGKYDGAYANGPTNMQILIATATSGVATEFNLSVLVGGIAVEVFPNLVNDNTSTNDAATVINAAGGSKLISATFLAAGVSPPVVGTFNMTGGDDGLTGLADTDYTGSQAGGTGFFAFDVVQGIRILLAPDEDSGTVQIAGVDYCEITREGSMFFVVTLLPGLTAAQAVTHVETTFALFGSSEYGAMYWPHVNILNPSRADYGDTDNILIPVSTMVAGVYAKIDGARPGGIHDEPAGTERGRLRGVVSLEGGDTAEVLDIRKRNLVYPKRINPITTFPGAPFFIDGVRVLKGDGNFPSVAQRRGVIDIEQNIKDGMEVYRYRANDEETRDEVNRTIRAFLLVRFNQKAFRGSTPDTSFFVNTDTDVNPPSEVDAGRLNVRIGLATQRPIEFLVLRFSQDTRDAEAEIAAA